MLKKKSEKNASQWPEAGPSSRTPESVTEIRNHHPPQPRRCRRTLPSVARNWP